MAEEQEQQSAFPAPPPYYTHFTAANVERLTQLRADAKLENDPIPASELASALQIPADLEYLIPPPLPTDGTYRTFGETRSLATPLPPLDPAIPSLLPDTLSGAALVRLTRAALLAFLELLHILATDPASDKYGPKWEDLRDVMLNAHRALNLYRPWAAREELIRLMEGWARTASAEVEKVKGMEERVADVLEGISGAGWGGGAGEDARMEIDDRDTVGTQNGGGGNGILNGETVVNGTHQQREAVLENERIAWSLADEVGAV